jgi:hypothetical protein
VYCKSCKFFRAEGEFIGICDKLRETIMVIERGEIKKDSDIQVRISSYFGCVDYDKMSGLRTVSCIY